MISLAARAAKNNKEGDAMMVMRLILGLVMVCAVASCSPTKQAQNERQGVADPRCDGRSDQAKCSESDQCEWLDSSCVGSANYCGDFTGKDRCPTACRWDDTASLCKKKASAIATTVDACTSYTTLENCKANITCDWQNNACSKKLDTLGNNNTLPNTNPTNPYDNQNNPQNPVNPQNPGNVNGCQALNVFACFMAQNCSYKFLPMPPHCADKI